MPDVPMPSVIARPSAKRSKPGGAPAWPPAALPDRTLESINEGGRAVLSGSIQDAHPGDVFFLDVNWGDGSGTKTYRFASAPSRKISVSHVYHDRGDYNVTTLWRSRKAQGSNATMQLHVENLPPLVSAGRDARLAPGGLLKRVGRFADPGLNDRWTATVDYGDGGGPEPLELGRGRTFRLKRKYSGAGAYLVTVLVTDSDGAVGNASFTVTTPH